MPTVPTSVWNYTQGNKQYDVHSASSGINPLLHPQDIQGYNFITARFLDCPLIKSTTPQKQFKIVTLFKYNFFTVCIGMRVSSKINWSYQNLCSVLFC